MEFLIHSKRKDEFELTLIFFAKENHIRLGNLVYSKADDRDTDTDMVTVTIDDAITGMLKREQLNKLRAIQ